MAFAVLFGNILQCLYLQNTFKSRVVYIQGFIFFLIPFYLMKLLFRRFLETSGRDLEVQRRLILLQQNVKRLEAENTVLRQRLTQFANGQIQVAYL